MVLKTATIEITQIGMVISSVFEEIFKNGLQPAGPVMTFYLDEEFYQEQANVEVCVPVMPCDEEYYTREECRCYLSNTQNAPPARRQRSG